MDIAQLDSAVHHYCGLGIATLTARTYHAAASLSFVKSLMCLVHFLSVSYCCVDLLRQWQGRGLAPATLKTYLAGIRHAQIIRGLSESGSASLPRLRLLQSGVACERAFRRGGPTRQRLPITPQLLSEILRVWAARSVSEHDKAMYSATASLCFYGFFRAGEITKPSTIAFDARVHLAWGNVAVDNATPPSSIRVHLKHSTCDQLGKGVDVFVGKSGDRSYPVAAGLEDSVIQSLGRWNSTAFHRYIHTPREQLAGYSRALAGGAPPPLTPQQPVYLSVEVCL